MDDATKRKHQPAARPARRKVVEEPFDPAPPPSAAAALPSHLVGAIVEKGFSAATPSSAPRPSVLPFPVARHRSHGPHWNPAAKDAGKAEGDEEDGMDVDETDYQPAATAAGLIRRKERKGMDFSRWREFVADDTPPKQRQAKSLQPTKQSTQKIDPGVVASKVGGAAEEKGFGGDGILLDSGNGRGQLGVVASVSDAASTKPMKQVDARDDLMKAGGAGVVELRGEDMQLDGGEPSLAPEINSENMARLAGMSAGEIAEAQADILNRMDPTLVEMLRQRGEGEVWGQERWGEGQRWGNFKAREGRKDYARQLVDGC